MWSTEVPKPTDDSSDVYDEVVMQEQDGSSMKEKGETNLSDENMEPVANSISKDRHMDLLNDDTNISAHLFSS